jgi:hypothetical protein
VRQLRDAAVGSEEPGHPDARTPAAAAAVVDAVVSQEELDVLQQLHSALRLKQVRLRQLGLAMAEAETLL